MSTHDTILRELEHDFNLPIRDPIWKHLHISEGFQRIIDTEPFQQLNRIKQLGPSYLVYPGATHTRFSHSLGVYHVAYRMLRKLLAAGTCPLMSPESARAYLCAALLHDLGHFPYAHSLKELPLEEHESIAARMIRDGDLAGIIRENVRTDPELVATIIDESLPVGSRPEVVLFRQLLSGTLDPDKLDYLNRDAYFCGVPYGIQDLDFVLSRLRTIEGCRVAIESSGISAVENILFSKYLMYRAVYWHRTVRVATAMIKKALFLGMQEDIITPRELYGLDDETLHRAFVPERHPAFVLIRQVAARRLYKNVYDAPFDPDHPEHSHLTELSERAAQEARIARKLSRILRRDVLPHEIIIDIPESVSFEISMPIVLGERVVDYPRAGTVFTPQVIQDFTRTLRRIRLFAPASLASEIRNPAELMELQPTLPVWGTE